MFIDKSMTRKVITISKDAGLDDAKRKMDENNIRHLPVVEADNTLIGIITDRDIRSALPSVFSTCLSDPDEMKRISELKVGDIMTRNPITISPSNTLEDAILMMHSLNKGALPVVDRQGKLTGIISTRDLIRAFINVLGLEIPGTLVCIEVEDKLGQMKRIVDAITEEGIPFGSILVARHWDEGKRAVFPYLLTSNVAKVKKKLKGMGYTLLDPMEWSLDQLPKADGTKKPN
ncbi:MAG TPA: CBS and ACT domain-containing protein [Dissulfurispiraceae bacterium]|nr:CBS and ACT domain-containing protein [Dissulfurispiraceae bacterium]